MDGQAVGSTSQGERAASRGTVSGTCAQCGGVYRGRADKRFCTDACRTRHGREQKAREVADLVARLQDLARRDR